MPQAIAPQTAEQAQATDPSRQDRDSQERPSGKPGSLVSRLTFFRELYPNRPEQTRTRKVIDLEGLDSFDLDTLEDEDARISTDKSRGAAVRRNAVFTEGRIAEVLAGYWPSISRSGRFITRTIHRGRYREVLTNEQILELEDAVSAHLSRALEALRAEEGELKDALADFGISSSDIQSANPKRLTMLVDNPAQSMALDLALAADSVVAQLRVLDSLYYRRGLTRSESSARTQQEIRRAVNRLDGALRFVFRVAQRTRSYCERTAHEQFEQIRQDEERRRQRQADELAARAREDAASEERLREIRAESDALWAGIEKEQQAERRHRQDLARKAAAEAIERGRREAEASFGPFATAAGAADASGAADAPGAADAADPAPARDSRTEPPAPAANEDSSSSHSTERPENPLPAEKGEFP